MQAPQDAGREITAPVARVIFDTLVLERLADDFGKVLTGNLAADHREVGLDGAQREFVSRAVWRDIQLGRNLLTQLAPLAVGWRIHADKFTAGQM
jgi:hypothetical protein